MLKPFVLYVSFYAQLLSDFQQVLSMLKSIKGVDAMQLAGQETCSKRHVRHVRIDRRYRCRSALQYDL